MEADWCWNIVIAEYGDNGKILVTYLMLFMWSQYATQL